MLLLLSRSPSWLLVLGLALLSLAPPQAQASCGQTATRIHAIQGRAATSPMLGSVRTVEAIVTASFVKDSELRGFFLQEADAQTDDDPLTSEGIFVFAPGRKAEVGERVRVTGQVTEYRKRTELSKVQRILRCGTAPLPRPIRLQPTAGHLEHLVRWEGMLVEIAEPLVVTDTYRLGRFHQLTLTPQRLYQPTQQQPPGRQARQAQHKQARLLLASGRRKQHPARIRFPAPQLTATHTVRSGDRTQKLRGVIDRFGSSYLLRTATAVQFEAANPRPTAPPPVSEQHLRVAVFNLLNYFNGDGRGGGFPTARGAATPAELQRQRQKLLSAMRAMDADIIGLVEIENDGYGQHSAIAELARELSLVSEQSYRFIHPGFTQLGEDAITVGLLYRPDAVRPMGAAAVLDQAVDSRFSSYNRPVLAQTFQQISNGEHLVVAVNHLKSKGSACRGDPDKRDGQGRCNRTRTRAAQALADWLAARPTGSGSENQLIIGDLNAYAQEDPVRALTTKGYVDLIADHLGNQAYTFVFDGRAGYLDYALASPALAQQVAAVRIWHINADEPAALDYRMARKTREQQQILYRADPYRSSDHDPVIVDLALQPANP